jgi:hypothetical protein
VLASKLRFGNIHITYQQPPALSLLSKARMVSKAFSWASASIEIAPAGPSPMTATDLIEDISGAFNGYRRFVQKGAKDNVKAVLTQEKADDRSQILDSY